MLRYLLPCLLLATLPLSAEAQTMNLLLNPQFDFHCFDNSRTARAACFSAGYVACWNAEAYGDITVTTAPHVESVKPRVAVRNIVAIKPGKHLYQVVFLPDVGLRHGDMVSLSVLGQQKAPGSLKASVHVLKIDSQTGKWKPSDFGMSRGDEFPKHSRGELVKAKSYGATSGAENDFALKLEKCEVVGTPPVHKNESSDEQINSIALMVEFENVGKEGDVLVYAPALVKGGAAYQVRTTQGGVPAQPAG
ncbi:MAG: hypothetical protein KKI08_17745, partial [Armatimonadetes bacterium]|nr:hypothetical protein [Armatimonadota bacterium]